MALAVWHQRLPLLLGLALVVAARGTPGQVVRGRRLVHSDTLPPVAGQMGGIFACCGAGGAITYGTCEAQVGGGIGSWQDFEVCWALARVHFGNTTKDPDNYNLTIAERYQIFSLVLSAEGGSSGLAGRPSGLLVLDASVIAPWNDDRLYGYLPYYVSIHFPALSDGTCPEFELHGLQLEFRSTLGDELHPYLAVKVNGCSPDKSKLTASSLGAKGWGNFEFNFLRVEASDILSVEPSAKQRAKGYTFALTIVESTLVGTALSYFGSAEMTIGNSGERTQNGVRAVRSKFVVVDPRSIMPGYDMPEGRGEYQMSWMGSFHAGAANSTWVEDFIHIENSSVEFVGDLQLGTIHALGSSFRPWLSPSSPIWGQEDPPLVELYRADSDQRAYGNNLTNCVVEYPWGSSLGQSLLLHTHVRWARMDESIHIPASWDNHRWANLTIDLQTDDPSNAFPQALALSLICSRPALVSGARVIGAQKVTVQNGTATPGTVFAHEGEQACLGAPRVHRPSMMFV